MTTMTIRTLCTAALVWAVLCLLAWAFVYAATKNDRRVDEERLQMTDIEIFKILRSCGMTAAGALGTMGNMRGESAMRSDNAQDSSGVDDAQYTAAVDTGNPEFLERFCRDQIGYGLCQWTHPDRKRKLLLHRREIRTLEQKTREKGLTLVPVSMYFKENGLVKVELALARGKKTYDKRQTIAKRDAQRDIDRAMKERYR